MLFIAFGDYSTNFRSKLERKCGRRAGFNFLSSRHIRPVIPTVHLDGLVLIGHLPATTINYVRNYGPHDDYMYNIIRWGNGYCTGLPYILIVQMSASRRLRLNFYLFLFIYPRTESDRRKYQIMELRTKRSGCGILLCFHVLQVLLYMITMLNTWVILLGPRVLHTLSWIIFCG